MDGGFEEKRVLSLPKPKSGIKKLTIEEAVKELREAAKRGDTQIQGAYAEKSPFLAKGFGYCGVGILLEKIRRENPGDYFWADTGTLEEYPADYEVLRLYPRHTAPDLYEPGEVFAYDQRTGREIWGNITMYNDTFSWPFAKIADELEKAWQERKL